MYEEDGEDLDSKKFSLPFLNILLQESFNAENSIRKALGEEILAQAPLLQSLDEEIPYHDSITKGALPYGLAWQYRVEAMDNYWAAVYRNLFETAINQATMFSWVGLDD